MKKGKRLILLLAIVAVFGVGAYLLNLNAKQQEAAKTAASESAKTVLLSSSAEDTAALAFTHDGQTVDLTKKDGQWVNTPGESLPLDASKVDRLLGNLKTVESVRTVADSNDASSDYGLASPAVVITVTGKDGTTQKISIGDKNTTNGDYYAAVDGKAGIYTISSDLYNAFDVSLASLLTEESFPTIDAASVTGVDWSANGVTKSLTYKADGDASMYSPAFQWFLQQAGGKLAAVNDNAVSTLVNTATGITYKSTAAATKEDLATYGLDHPQLTLTLHYTEQVPQSQAEAVKAQEAASLATPIPTVQPTATPTAAPAATTAATNTSAPATAAATSAVATAAATAQAPTATPTVKAARNAALAEDASAVPTETPTAEPTATPEPTVPVERTLTLWLGNLDADGNIYMTHNQTDRVYVITAETMQALLKLTDDDLRVSQPVNLRVSDLTGMTATMNGVTKTITTSAQSVAAQGGEQTTQIVYQVDGKPLKTTLFSLFVNSLAAIRAESYTDKPVATNAMPLLNATFTQNRTGFESIPVAFYPYDESFDQAVVNGDATMLVNKRAVDALQTCFDQLVGTEATATPATASTTAPTAP